LEQAVEEQGYLPQIIFNDDKNRPEIQAREVGCHDTIQGVQEQAQEGRAIEVTPFFTKSSV